MGILVWIVFGALVGWIASMITRTNDQQGGLANIIVGIIGALIGGLISRGLGGEGITGFNISSFLVALLGAVILVTIVKVLTRSPQ